MAFFPEEAAGADLVISWSADCRLTADGVLVHLNVKDSQVTLRGICVNGGKIVCPKIEIEVDGFGVFFYSIPNLYRFFTQKNSADSRALPY